MLLNQSLNSLLATPDLLSREFYGERLVSVPPTMRLPDAVESIAREKLGHYFERLVSLGIQSLSPIRHHGHLQIRRDKNTLGELDVVFQLPGENHTHHWELAVKYYLRVGRYFIGITQRDRLDFKLHKLFHQQLALTELSETRALLADLGYPSALTSQAWVKGMLFYPDGETPEFPPQIATTHARGVWSVGLPARYANAQTHWVLLPKHAWPLFYRSETSDEIISGIDAAKAADNQTGLMWARVEQAEGFWVERERVCVVNQNWVTQLEQSQLT